MAIKKRSLWGEGSLFHQLRKILCHVLSDTNEDRQEPGSQSFLPALLDQIDEAAQ